MDGRKGLAGGAATSPRSQRPLSAQLQHASSRPRREHPRRLGLHDRPDPAHARRHSRTPAARWRTARNRLTDVLTTRRAKRVHARYSTRGRTDVNCRIRKAFASGRSRKPCRGAARPDRWNHIRPQPTGQVREAGPGAMHGHRPRVEGSARRGDGLILRSHERRPHRHGAPRGGAGCVTGRSPWRDSAKCLRIEEAPR
jgi:hypothetical protein